MRALDTSIAARHDNFVRLREIYGIEIATDSRSVQDFGAGTYVVSEPYILTTLEFGLDHTGRELAHRILKVQEARYLRRGILTAVSEDNLDRAPHFAYNSIFANAREWVAVTEDGDIHNEIKSLSTKAAFAWDMIYRTEYTALLKAEAWKARSADQGWFAGIYESNGEINAIGTANTNGIILEALHFRAFGPMISYRR